MNGEEYECTPSAEANDLGVCTSGSGGSGGGAGTGGGGATCDPTTYANGCPEGCDERCTYEAGGVTTDLCTVPCDSDADCATNSFATTCASTDTCNIMFMGSGTAKVCVIP